MPITIQPGTKIFHNGESEEKIRAREKRFSKPTFRQKKYCSYCNQLALLTTVTERVKREPLPGGQDLNLWDEVSQQVWKCTKCGGIQKTGYELVVCEGCRSIAVMDSVAHSAPDWPISIRTIRERKGEITIINGCTNCAVCAVCKKSLKTRDYLFDMITYVGDLTLPVDRWFSLYYHIPCALQLFEHEWEQALIKKGLCLKCERPLSFMEKLKGLKTHQKPCM